MKDKISILIADDNPDFARTLTSYIEEDEELEVIAIARDGKQAVEMILNTDEKSYTIAEKVGYLDANYFSYVFKVNMNSTMIIKYDYDIDLADFNHTNYILVRDNTQSLYIVVYTVDGEYIEKDLEDESNKMDFSDRYRLAFYNKFNYIFIKWIFIFLFFIIIIMHLCRTCFN